MKNNNIFKVLSVIMTITVIIMTRCSQEESLSSGTNDSTHETINFGQIHNDIIEDIIQNLKNGSTRVEEVSNLDSLRSYCIDRATSYVLSLDSELQYDQVRNQIKRMASVSEQYIKESMTNSDTQVVQTITQMIYNGNSQYLITNYIDNTSLPNIRKMAANNYNKTYHSSIEYWNREGNSWINYLKRYPSKKLRWYEKISWGQVAFSDAYYGWFGTVNSAGNIYVGVGTAAVGSIFTILNQM